MLQKRTLCSKLRRIRTHSKVVEKKIKLINVVSIASAQIFRDKNAVHHLFTLVTQGDCEEKKREDFFFNFPSSMKKGKFFWGISLLACGKGRDFFEFPFSHEKKSEKNEFLPTKMSKISDFLWEGKRFFSHFSLRGNFFGGFPFPHVKRKEIVFSFSFSTTTL